MTSERRAERCCTYPYNRTAPTRGSRRDFLLRVPRGARHDADFQWRARFSINAGASGGSKDDGEELSRTIAAIEAWVEEVRVEDGKGEGVQRRSPAAAAAAVLLQGIVRHCGDIIHVYGHTLRKKPHMGAGTNLAWGRTDGEEKLDDGEEVSRMLQYKSNDERFQKTPVSIKRTIS